MFLRKKKALSALIASSVVVSCAHVQPVSRAVGSLIGSAVLEQVIEFVRKHPYFTFTAGGLTGLGGYYLAKSQGVYIFNGGLISWFGFGPYSDAQGSYRNQLVSMAYGIEKGDPTSYGRNADWRVLYILADQLPDNNTPLSAWSLYKFLIRELDDTKLNTRAWDAKESLFKKGCFNDLKPENILLDNSIKLN